MTNRVVMKVEVFGRRHELSHAKINTILDCLPITSVNAY